MYYSYCKNPTGWEFFVPIRTLIGVKLLTNKPIGASPGPRPLIPPAGCCIASRFATLFCLVILVVPPSHCLIVLLYPPLVVSSCQLVVASSLIVILLCHPLVHSSCRLVGALPLLVPPSHPLVVPAIFASPSSFRRSPTPSNTVECCLRHRMPLPPPPLNVVSIVH